MLKKARISIGKTKLKDEDMLPNMFEQNINTPKKGILSTIFQGYRMTESILQIVEQFYSILTKN